MEQYYLRQLRACQPISLQQLLDAKEARVLRQQRMMQQEGTLISFTLNIAGGVKSFPLFSYAFALGKESILLQLQFAGAEVLQQEEVHQPTGDELCLLTDLEPLEVKRLMTQIEEDGALGRLFDIDVMTAESPKISRQQLGLPPRLRRCVSSRRQFVQEARRMTSGSCKAAPLQIICEQLMGRCADDIAPPPAVRCCMRSTPHPSRDWSTGRTAAHTAICRKRPSLTAVAPSIHIFVRRRCWVRSTAATATPSKNCVGRASKPNSGCVRRPAESTHTREPSSRWGFSVQRWQQLS